MPTRGGKTSEQTRSIRILYVDDEPEFAALAAEFLTREDDGFDVEIEEGGHDALERLTEEPIDCVVSDYDMPGMDGLALLEAVRDRHPGVPFVLVTGKGSEEIASEAISAGVTDYLQKRGGREQYTILANRIRNAVEQYRVGREAAHHRRVSELVRDVTRALVGATSRSEIEQAVCDRIADSEPYLFAWIGDEDGDGRIRPRTSAGVEDGYLDEITVSADEEPTGRGPAGTAFREGAVSVAQDVQRDPSFEPWREPALERGFRSVAGVPLVHGGTTHGVLLVYAAHVDAFDETERALLAELGDAIGHAMDAMEVRDRLERQYRDLFETAPVMYALTRNEDGSPVVSGCNQRFLDRLGYDRDAIVGSPLAGLYTEESTAKLLDEGGYDRALSGEFLHEERQLLTADGEVVQTLLRAVPRYDADGATIGTLTLFVDITKRRRADAFETQAAAMEASIDGMAILDADESFQYVNGAHASMYGYDAEEMLGEDWRLLYDEERIEWFESEVWPTVERGDEWHGESVGLRSDGSSFPQELSLSPLDDGGLVCVVRDVTERKAAERELERQNRRLEQFASVVSHDLRGPLNIAQGNVGLVRTADDVDDPLDAIETALDRMERTIDDTLSFALGAGGVEDSTVVSLERTVPDCWHRSDEQVVVVDDLRFVADRDLLQRLFENLFRNSVEHGSTSLDPRASGNGVEHGSTGSRTGSDNGVEHGSTSNRKEGRADDDVERRSTTGRPTVAANDRAATTDPAGDGATATPETSVEVRVGPLTDEPGFFVEDDGPGIPPEEREAVFEPGYSTSPSGTGLGLDIVRRIAHKHGWDCRLTASSDEGVRFEFAGVDVVETDSEAD